MYSFNSRASLWDPAEARGTVGSHCFAWLLPLPILAPQRWYLFLSEVPL